MYARYRQVSEYLPTTANRRSIRLNKASLGLGLLSSLGVSIVGNFQVRCLAILLLVFVENNKRRNRQQGSLQRELIPFVAL